MSPVLDRCPSAILNYDSLELNQPRVGRICRLDEEISEIYPPKSVLDLNRRQFGDVVRRCGASAGNPGRFR